MTRAEHLAWAKTRALEYVTLGKPTAALTSITSDFGKHPDLAGHAGLELGGMLALAGHLSTPAQVRDWIEGLN